MKSRAMTLLAAVVAAAALAGCASFPGTARPATFDELRREEGWLLLDSVPFVRQVSGKGCGAACLAMVLRHWGDGPAVEELERECFAPGQDGIRASDLRDAARRRGLAAYLFRGTLDDLEHELARGRPVVVGLAKPAGGGLLAHFEVVVGIHRARGRIAATCSVQVRTPQAGSVQRQIRLRHHSTTGRPPAGMEFPPEAGHLR